MNGKNIALAALLASSMLTGHAFAADAPAPVSHGLKPTCVLMEFTDDTRFAGLDTTKRLSENLMVKLLQSGRFNLQERNYVSGDLEKQLYEDNYPAVLAGRAAIEAGDYNAVFESPSFADGAAQDLATASVGQVLAPAVTAKIGAQQGADYLIQCTVLDVGVGTWEDYNFRSMMGLAGSVVDQFTGGLGSLLGGLFGGSTQMKAGFGLLTDVRVIKASTGEIVWARRISEQATTTRTYYGLGASGSDTPSHRTYEKAIEKISDKILKELLADMNAGKLAL